MSLGQVRVLFVTDCLFAVPVILNTIRHAGGSEVRLAPLQYTGMYDGADGCRLQWKVLVVDETSRKLIYNATNDDDILNLNVTSKPLTALQHKSASANSPFLKMSSRSSIGDHPIPTWMRCTSCHLKHTSSTA
jgi:hypothetical protein